jgi:hypothetical protein
VSATYSGDGNFDGSSATFIQRITKSGSRTSLSVTNPTSSGTRGSVTATVSGTAATAGTPTGTVVFNVVGSSGPAVQCDGGDTVTLASGTATCVISTALVSSGSPYTVNATYSGDGNFTTSAASPAQVRVPRVG